MKKEHPAFQEGITAFPERLESHSLPACLKCCKSKTKGLMIQFLSANQESEVGVPTVKPMAYSVSTNGESHILDPKNSRINNDNIIFYHGKRSTTQKSKIKGNNRSTHGGFNNCKPIINQSKITPDGNYVEALGFEPTCSSPYSGRRWWVFGNNPS